MSTNKTITIPTAGIHPIGPEITDPQQIIDAWEAVFPKSDNPMSVEERLLFGVVNAYYTGLKEQ